MTTWPSTLPQRFNSDNFQDADPDYVVVSQMDVGPPKLRKRCSIAPRTFSGSMLLSLTQRDKLKAFYATYCSSPFEFPDPDTGELINVVFAKEPQYSSNDGVYRIVDLSLVDINPSSTSYITDEFGDPLLDELGFPILG